MGWVSISVCNMHIDFSAGSISTMISSGWGGGGTLRLIIETMGGSFFVGAAGLLAVALVAAG